MKVIHICPWFPHPVSGGMEKQALLLVQELAATGHECAVISYNFPGALPAAEHAAYKLHRLESKTNTMVGKLLLALRMFRILWQGRKKYEIIHAHTFSDIGLLGVIFGKLLGYASVVKMPNVGDFGALSLQKTRLGFLRLYFLKKSDAIIALSTESVVELLKIGYSKEKIVLTPNGVKIRPKVRRQKVRKSNNGVIKLGFLGRLTQQKNVEMLIRALSNLEERCGLGQAKLVLAGDGPLYDDLVTLVNQVVDPTSVSFLGHIEKVDDFFDEIDMLILPSFAEGNSNAILEAMAFGLPVVATPVGGTETLLGSESTRYLFNPNDLDSLVNILQESIGQEDYWRAEGAKNYDRAKKYFDIEEVAKFYLEMYSALKQPHEQREFMRHGVFS